MSAPGTIACGTRSSRSSPRVLSLILLHHACLLGLWLAALGLPRCTPAQVLDQRALKAAYVFNLTKYVEWPQPSRELLVGFVGDGPMGESLEKLLSGKASESRQIRVLLSPKDEALEKCEILYVAYASSKRTQEILQQLRGKGVLTIGDSDSFTADGGMIGLVKHEQQIQIQVNLQAAQQSGLKISSRVLGLATIVHSKEEAKN